MFFDRRVNAQSSGDPTKTNFYSSDLEILVSFPSDNNRAVVIPEKRMKQANNAIDSYQNGNMSNQKLYNVLSLHGQEYSLYFDVQGRAVITKPTDLNYYFHFGAYVLSKGRMRKTGGEIITYDLPYGPENMDPYFPKVVNW